MTDQPEQQQPKPKKKKATSRSGRWAEAVGDAKEAISEILAKVDELEAACSALTDVKGEYEEWQGNLPENLASSPLGEKLQAVVDLDFEGLAESVRTAAEEAEGTLDEAESIDLPRGFGRD